MLKKDGIITELKKGKTNVDIVLIQDFVCCADIPMMLAIYTLRKTWGFSERHYSLKDFSCFFFVFFCFDLDWKTGFHCQKDLFFFILKDFQLIQKDLLFLILKDIFHQKDLDVKERQEFSSERHVFLFSERLFVVIFFRKTCNFFQKDF